jgi:hypothetical protein
MSYQMSNSSDVSSIVAQVDMIADLVNDAAQLPQLTPRVALLGPLIDVVNAVKPVSPPARAGSGQLDEEPIDPQSIRLALRASASRRRSRQWRFTRNVNRNSEIVLSRADVAMVLARAFKRPDDVMIRVCREIEAGATPQRVADKLLVNPRRYGLPANLELPPTPADMLRVLVAYQETYRTACELADSELGLLGRPRAAT